MSKASEKLIGINENQIYMLLARETLPGLSEWKSEIYCKSVQHIDSHILCHILLFKQFGNTKSGDRNC